MKKLFGTDGIRGKANEFPMLPEIALKLGIALAKSFGKAKIVVGKDTRESGYIFEYALASGICAAGGEVHFAGVIPTPAVAFLTKKANADAGIMISASHNPAPDNGIKIFSKQGYKLSDEVEESIEQAIFSDTKLPEEPGKAFRIKTAARDYIDFAKNAAGGRSLKGMKIVIDCANGAAYGVAPLILSELGAEVIAFNNSPDGRNINDKCGAVHPENIKEAVIKNNANIGIALDGDADRIIVLDEKGDIVDGDRIMYICAKMLKKEGKLRNNTVITTVMSNTGLAKALKKEGIEILRTMVGDRYVIEKMKETGCNFGGEQSGHIIISDYTTTGDGIICAIMLLSIMHDEKQPISALTSGIELFPQEIVNLRVKEKREFTEMPAVLKAIEEAEKHLGDNGRVLVRYSGTENKARIMVEAKEAVLAKQIAEEISGKIREEIGSS